MIFERADFSDPIQRNCFHCWKQPFSTLCTFFAHLYRFALFIALVKSCCFHCFSGFSANCDERSDLEIFLLQIQCVARCAESFLLCRSK